MVNILRSSVKSLRKQKMKSKIFKFGTYVTNDGIKLSSLGKKESLDAVMPCLCYMSHYANSMMSHISSLQDLIKMDWRISLVVLDAWEADIPSLMGLASNIDSGWVKLLLFIPIVCLTMRRRLPSSILLLPPLPNAARPTFLLGEREQAAVLFNRR